MKTTLLIKYNKVTNDAFKNLSIRLHNTKICDLRDISSRIDTLSFDQVDMFLRKSLPFDVVVIGDIFWPTGQYICKWCIQNHKKCIFLQHGQWIYIDNKKNPRYLPDATFVYGNNIANMVNEWPYACRSKVYVTGNPRYDNISREPSTTQYVYFCPPVLLETSPSGSDRTHSKSMSWVSSFKGIDNCAQVLIHPHYREGNTRLLKQWFPQAIWCEPEGDPLSYIQQSRVVVTHRNSTTVLDAIACNRQCILMNYGRFDKSFFKRGYFKSFVDEIESPSHCFDVINSNHNRNIKNYESAASAYILLGDASSRIQNIIGII